MINSNSYPFIIGLLISNDYFEFLVVDEEKFLKTLGLNSVEQFKADEKKYTDLLSIYIREDGTKIEGNTTEHFTDAFGLKPVLHNK